MAEFALDWSPTGIPKKAMEAITAKTYSGQELSGTQRLVHALQSASLLIAYITFAQEMSGGTSSEMATMAIAGKVFTYMSSLVMNKGFVMEQLSKIPEYSAATVGIASGVAVAVAKLPDNMFSNEIIQLNLNS